MIGELIQLQNFTLIIQTSCIWFTLVATQFPRQKYVLNLLSFFTQPLLVGLSYRLHERV